MKAPRHAAPGPFATRARAGEIALMDNIGLAEFTELTGVGIGDHGIYRVGATGISLRASESLADFTAVQQNAIHQAARLLTLGFSCTPAQLMTWYDATRGTDGVSDFPLAKGFAEELRRHEASSSGGGRPSFPSVDVVAAFKVLADEGANAAWWDTRLRNPGRYRLTLGRALKGGAKRRSRWYPDIVAAWLIHEQHLERDTVLRAMRQHFPGYDVDLI